MKWILMTIGLAMLCMTSFVQAQTKDVPELAEWEIQRRGNHVERTGTYRSGLMAAALSPPKDDSEKWFLTLVVKSGDPASEQMKHVLNDAAMKPWVDIHDPGRSQMHFQLRNIEDRTQADWLSGLRPAIERGGLPVVVVQPPRSGKFGDPKRIVKTIHGTLSGRELAEKLRESVIDYINAIEIPNDHGLIGVPAPFNVQPPPQAQPPVNPPAALPFEFPPARPQEVTIEQIQAVCPGAPAEFVLKMINDKVTSLEMVKLHWSIYQSNNKKPAEEVCTPPAAITEKVQPANPFPPSLLWPLATMGALILGMIIASGVAHFRNRSTVPNSVAASLAALAGAVGTNQTSSLSSPVPQQYTTFPQYSTGNPQNDFKSASPPAKQG